MGKMDGKVALITGAARGQGRAHAVALASEGAEIVALDVAEAVKGVPYPGATAEDLAETVRLVEELDRRCLAVKADVRDRQAVADAVEAAIAEFGRIDVAAINHGIGISAPWDEVSEEDWETQLDVNYTGVWRVATTVIPHMVKQGGGSVIITSSTAGLGAYYGLTAYGSTKHAVIGLMRNLAAELAPHRVRVNCVCPTNCSSPMVINDVSPETFTGQPGATVEDMKWIAESHLLLPIPWVEPEDVANAVLFLASDDGRYITGVALPIDGGTSIQPAGIPPIAMELLGELGFRHEPR